MTEADTCRKYVVPKLVAAGWEDEPHSIPEQSTLADDRLKRERQDFFGKFAPEARAVLSDLLDKYTEHGATQFQFPDALKIPPISERGSVMEIAGYFGGRINCVPLSTNSKPFSSGCGMFAGKQAISRP